jgi:hypothetical protein
VPLSLLATADAAIDAASAFDTRVTSGAVVDFLPARPALDSENGRRLQPEGTV